MKRIALSVAMLGLLCGVGFAEAKGDVQQRLNDALDKAGLKIVAAAPADAAAAIAAEEDAQFDAILKKLEGPLISVEYKNAPMAEVFAELQKASGVNMALDPKLQKEDTPVNLKLEKVKPISVLQNLLKMHNLAATYAGESLLITAAANIEEEAITISYDVSEITMLAGDRPARSARELAGITTVYSQDQQLYWLEDRDREIQRDAREQVPAAKGRALVGMLRAATLRSARDIMLGDEGPWDGATSLGDVPLLPGAVPSINYVNGMLVVTAPPAVQEQVAKILITMKTGR